MSVSTLQVFSEVALVSVAVAGESDNGTLTRPINQLSANTLYCP